MKPLLSLMVLLLGAASAFQAIHNAKLRADLERSQNAYATLQSDYGQSVADLAQIREQLWITKAEGEIFARALVEEKRANSSLTKQ